MIFSFLQAYADNTSAVLGTKAKRALYVAARLPNAVFLEGADQTESVSLWGFPYRSLLSPHTSGAFNTSQRYCRSALQMNIDDPDPAYVIGTIRMTPLAEYAIIRILVLDNQHRQIPLATVDVEGELIDQYPDIAVAFIPGEGNHLYPTSEVVLMIDVRVALPSWVSLRIVTNDGRTRTGEVRVVK